MVRVKALPQDYQIVYKEIHKCLFNVGPVELVDFVEEESAMGKGVLEVNRDDVAVLCEDLVKDSAIYADLYQGSVDAAVFDAMKKVLDEKR